MDNQEKVKIEEKLREIVTATTKLSFPFFSDKKKKEAIIMKEKKHIDCLIDRVLENYNATVDTTKYNRNKIWEDTEIVAMGKFKNLPVSCQINSFLLQELMHEYADNQAKLILQLISVGD